MATVMAQFHNVSVTATRVAEAAVITTATKYLVFVFPELAPINHAAPRSLLPTLCCVAGCFQCTIASERALSIALNQPNPFGLLLWSISLLFTSQIPFVFAHFSNIRN
jgi:hypothetical protein